MKDMNDKKQVFIIRCLIVVFIAISAVIAVIQYKQNVSFIAQLMGISWGALAGAFLAPFLYGLYWKKTTTAACWASFIFGVGVMVLNIYTYIYLFSSFLAIFHYCRSICNVSRFVIVPVVSFITPKLEKNFVERAFSCYEKKVEVVQKKTLGD